MMAGPAGFGGFGGFGGIGGVTTAGISLTFTLNCDDADDDAVTAKH
jgi:hypothetical protein